MPRKKKVGKTIVRKIFGKVIVKKAKKVEKAPEEIEEVKKPEVKVAEKAPIVLPVYEGKQVVRIRDDGRELKDFYHCDALDGDNRITMHVPKSLF